MSPLTSLSLLSPYRPILLCIVPHFRLFPNHMRWADLIFRRYFHSITSQRKMLDASHSIMPYPLRIGWKVWESALSVKEEDSVISSVRRVSSFHLIYPSGLLKRYQRSCLNRQLTSSAIYIPHRRRIPR